MYRLLISILLFTFSLTYLGAQSCNSNSNSNYNYNNYNKKNNNQSQSPQKAIFVEWRGNGIGKSINFDSRFGNGSNGFGMRIGLGATDLELNTADVSDVEYTALTIPAGINYIMGKRRHGLEAGVGYTTILDKNSDEHEGQAFLNFGYRFKPKKSGILFRFTYTPTFDANEIEFGKTGISLGWAF